ncbi:MAG: hypothetical protein ACP5M4_09690 [Acidobacteriaceae bacterium]
MVASRFENSICYWDGKGEGMRWAGFVVVLKESKKWEIGNDRSSEKGKKFDNTEKRENIENAGNRVFLQSGLRRGGVLRA